MLIIGVSAKKQKSL